MDRDTEGEQSEITEGDYTEIEGESEIEEESDAAEDLMDEEDLEEEARKAEARAEEAEAEEAAALEEARAAAAAAEEAASIEEAETNAMEAASEEHTSATSEVVLAGSVAMRAILGGALQQLKPQSVNLTMFFTGSFSDEQRLYIFSLLNFDITSSSVNFTQIREREQRQ